MPKDKKGMRAAWLLILCAAFVILGGAFLGKYLRMAGTDKYSARILCQLPLLIPAAAGIIYTSRVCGRIYTAEALGIRGFSPAFTFLLLLLPLSARYFGAFIQFSEAGFIKEAFSVSPSSAPVNTVEMLMLFLSNCIIAPTLEEIIFRGGVFKALEPYGSVRAVILSALGFAIIHFDTSGFIYLFLWGTVLGLVRVWSGSLFACMLFHSVLNFESFLHTVFVNDLQYVMDFLGGYATVMAYLFPVILLLTYILFGRGKSVRKSVRSGLGGAVPMLLTVALYGLTALMRHM